MWTLYLGVLLFGGTHIFSILMPRARDGLKQSWGEKAWKGLYSLASLAGFVLMSMAYFSGRAGPASLDLVYEPWYGARHLTMLLVWAGFVLIGASHGKGYIKKFLRHPMSLGIALWSLGHLLVNGEKAVVYIFATFFVVALLDIILSLARGKRPVHEPVVRSDIIAVIVGTVLTLVLMFGFHPYVLNIPVVG